MKNNLDLRDELYTLLFTDKETDKISRPVIWTAYRRNGKDKINCSACNPHNQGYVEGQLGCPYCDGKGYMWDQKIIEGYMYKQNEGKDRYNLNMLSNAGKSNTTSYVLVTPFDIEPMIEDTISIIKLNSDNKIEVPIQIKETVKVVYSRNMKASQNDKDFHISYLGG